MKITIEVPDAIIEHCKELNISQENIPKLFQFFIYDRLGFDSHWGIDSFLEWCEEDDNICDFVD